MNVWYEVTLGNEVVARDARSDGNLYDCDQEARRVALVTATRERFEAVEEGRPPRPVTFRVFAEGDGHAL